MSSHDQFVTPAPPPGAAPAEQFIAALRAVGGQGLLAAGPSQAAAMVLAALQERGVTAVIAWDDPLLKGLGLPDASRAAGIEWFIASADADPAAVRSVAARAGAGVTGAHCAVAETGSLVLLSGPGRPRSVSLLPPLHIAIVTADQVLMTVAELSGALSRLAGSGELPSSLNLVTGPSRTADIEHISVPKVHGPGEVLALVLQP